MTKNKFTKKTLISSILSLGLSCSMLIGTTFAWFSDTDSVKVNPIVSGNLDVELVDANGDELTEALKFQKVSTTKNGSSVAGGETIIWQPGSTYELQPVYIKNNGDMDLKYEINIKGIEGDAELLKAIDWTIKLGGTEVKLDELNGVLEAGKSTEALVITGHMKEDAGNEYKKQTIEGVSINVVATQNDENAVMPVLVESNEELGEALENIEDEASIVLSGEFTLPSNFSNAVNGKAITFEASEGGATIDLGAVAHTASGTDLTFKNITLTKTNDDYKGFHHSASETYIGCTFKGTYFTYAPTATFEDCTFEQDSNDAYNIWTYGAETVNFNNCTFNSAGKSVLIYNEGHNDSAVNFEGCKFTATQKGYTSENEHCAAIEIDSRFSEFIVNINDSTADSNFSGLVRNKKGDHTTIYVNGVKQELK